MTELINTLTDIATHKLVDKDLQIAFDEIATGLLRHTKIVTPKDHFLIREIEIYFYDEDNHPDPYTHDEERLSEFGEWRFHWFKHSSTFLKSKRSGIDITFGNKAENIFGGILIRIIQNIKTDDIIIGVNKVVKKLIENVDGSIIIELEKAKLDDIARDSGNLVFDKNYLLHLELTGNTCAKPIYKSIREVGKPYTEEEKEYHTKLYRYFNFPEIKQVLA